MSRQTLVVTSLAAAGVALQSKPAAVECPALPPSSLPAAGSLPAISPLPDPFAYWDGTRLPFGFLADSGGSNAVPNPITCTKEG